MEMGDNRSRGLVGSPASDLSSRPMDRTGNVADLIPQQRHTPSLLLVLLTQLCLPPFHPSTLPYMEDTWTPGVSLLVPAPGARKLLGTQSFEVAEAGRNFSAEDELHLGTENYIPSIPAYINAISVKNPSETHSSQLTLFTSCIPLFTLCLMALPPSSPLLSKTAVSLTVGSALWEMILLMKVHLLPGCCH